MPSEVSLGGGVASGDFRVLFFEFAVVLVFGVIRFFLGRRRNGAGDEGFVGGGVGKKAGRFLFVVVKADGNEDGYHKQNGEKNLLHFENPP